MSQRTDVQAEFDALHVEFERYITGLRSDWTAKNKSTSRDVYEVMSQRERDEVDRIRANWGRYVTPLAEAWWKARDYEVIWPGDDREPMQFRRLEAV